MSTTTALIAEVVRAANRPGKVDQAEAGRLLGRAVTVIRDMREEIGIVGLGTAKDAVIALQTSAVAIGLSERADAQVKAALLDAAALVRDLSIVLDSRNHTLGRS